MLTALLHLLWRGLFSARRRKLDLQSGQVQTLELQGVPKPRQDPDAEPLRAGDDAGEAPPVPQGAVLVMSDAAISSQHAQVGQACSSSRLECFH